MAPVIFVVMPASLKPNGDTESSATDTEVAVGAPDHQPAEAAGAEIGLFAFVDHLLQPGPETVAIEHMVDGLDRGLLDPRGRRTGSGHPPGC